MPKTNIIHFVMVDHDLMYHHSGTAYGFTQEKESQHQLIFGTLLVECMNNKQTMIRFFNC